MTKSILKMGESEDNSNFDNKKKEAAFNMAVKFLERLHDLWLQANYYSQLQLHWEWYLTLKCIHREISFKLTSKEKEEYDNLKTKLNDFLLTYQRWRNDKKIYNIIPIDELLGDYEMLLKKHMDAHGLIMPTKEAIDDIMKKM